MHTKKIERGGVWNWMRKVTYKEKDFGVEWQIWLLEKKGLEVNNEGEQHTKRKNKVLELSNEYDLHKTSSTMKAIKKDIKGLELSNKGNLHKKKERRFGIEKTKCTRLFFFSS